MLHWPQVESFGKIAPRGAAGLITDEAHDHFLAILMFFDVNRCSPCSTDPYRASRAAIQSIPRLARGNLSSSS
jgi:hypothetical protein